MARKEGSALLCTSPSFPAFSLLRDMAAYGKCSAAHCERLGSLALLRSVAKQEAGQAWQATYLFSSLLLYLSHAAIPLRDRQAGNMEDICVCHHALPPGRHGLVLRGCSLFIC